VLGQCRELVHLNLRCNYIGVAGVERVAGVLAQCPALAHLNLTIKILCEGIDIFKSA
jgi:hypothetical protein